MKRRRVFSGKQYHWYLFVGTPQACAATAAAAHDGLRQDAPFLHALHTWRDVRKAHATEGILSPPRHHVIEGRGWGHFANGFQHLHALRHDLDVRLVFNGKGRVSTKHEDQDRLCRDGVTVQNQVRAVVRREPEEIGFLPKDGGEGEDALVEQSTSQ